MPACTLVVKVRISEGTAYSTPTVGPRDRTAAQRERTNSEGDVCSLPADAHSTAFSLLQPRAPSPFPTRITSFHFIAAVLAGRRRARIEAKERRVGEASRRRAGEASRRRAGEASRMVGGEQARRGEQASEACGERGASEASGESSQWADVMSTACVSTHVAGAPPERPSRAHVQRREARAWAQATQACSRHVRARWHQCE